MKSKLDLTKLMEIELSKNGHIAMCNKAFQKFVDASEQDRNLIMEEFLTKFGYPDLESVNTDKLKEEYKKKKYECELMGVFKTIVTHQLGELKSKKLEEECEKLKAQLKSKQLSVVL